MNKVIRMIFLLVVFSLGFGLFSFAQASGLNQAQGIKYKVKKGDMLRKISLKYYGTEKKAKFLARVNGIKNPDRIYAGSDIEVPYLGKKVSLKKHAKSLRNSVAVKSQAKEIGIKKDEKASAVEKAAKDSDDTENAEQTSKVVAQPGSAPRIDDNKFTSAEENASEKAKQEVPIAPIEKSKGITDMVSVIRGKSESAREGKEPMSQSNLEFTADDVIPESVPEAAETEPHAHGASDSEALEHQLSLNTTYSKNKSDRMIGGMFDYMAWLKAPSLGENYSLGGGIFTSAWEDETSKARIRGIMPGVQLGIKYNRHTDDHLMRMAFGKLMVGREFQSVRRKARPALVLAMDPMSKMASMETEDTMPTAADDAMDQDASSAGMDQAMPIKSGNNFRIGSMLGLHYQLNPKSTLELMNENWFSLGGRTAMEMDPAFSLVASHVYTSGDWSWRLGLGPQYEDWSRTWRLHVVPAEVTYKEMITLGVFSDLYPWKKGEMYNGFSSRDLTSIGAVLRFNMGTSMHKGHEIKTE